MGVDETGRRTILVPAGVVPSWAGVGQGTLFLTTPFYSMAVGKINRLGSPITP